MAWPPTTHQDVQDAVSSLRTAPFVGGSAATGTPSGTTYLRGDGAWATPSGSGGGSAHTGDRVTFVSKSGSDANDGLSWATAKLTIGAAYTALSGNPGTVNVGAGTYQETLTLAGNVTIRGQGRYATIIELTASGTLINITNQNNCRLEHLWLRFASSAVTGTLLYLSNTFTCDFVDVQLSGTTTAGQVGHRYLANAGDSHFTGCYFTQLGVGVQCDSTVQLFASCVFSSCATAVQSGDVTGASAPGGAVFTDCVFRGTSDYYVNIVGTTQAFHFKGCWFDGNGATTAVQVGAGTFGPWLFTMTDCPSILGKTASLVVNAAKFFVLHGCVFGNDGHNPTDLTVNATNAPRGSIAGCFSLQSTKLETLVPPKWLGATGYVQSADGTVSLVETYEDMNVGISPLTKRRMVIRVVNRATGTAAATLTFPSAFETAFGGGQFFKVFDNTGANPTVTSTSITFPTGVAVSSGLVILEGF